MAKKITKEEARTLAKKVGVDFNKDFYQQGFQMATELVAIAKLKGYRKPKNANGSTARYFFQYLKKK
jgi:hypothetical protein